MKNTVFRRLISLFNDKRFIVFIIIGVINTFNSIIISYLLSSIVNPNLSFVIGYIISLGIAYLLNGRFNFKQPLTMSGFLKFAVSYIPNFIIQNGIVLLLYNLISLPKIIAYGAAAILGIPVTFALLKLFAFRKK